MYCVTYDFSKWKDLHFKMVKIKVQVVMLKIRLKAAVINFFFFTVLLFLI